jgi:hypothetical protein
LTSPWYSGMNQFGFDLVRDYRMFVRESKLSHKFSSLHESTNVHQPTIFYHYFKFFWKILLHFTHEIIMIIIHNKIEEIMKELFVLLPFATTYCHCHIYNNRNIICCIIESKHQSIIMNNSCLVYYSIFQLIPNYVSLTSLARLAAI